MADADTNAGLYYIVSVGIGVRRDLKMHSAVKLDAAMAWCAVSEFANNPLNGAVQEDTKAGVRGRGLTVEEGFSYAILTGRCAVGVAGARS